MKLYRFEQSFWYSFTILWRNGRWSKALTSRKIHFMFILEHLFLIFLNWKIRSIIKNNWYFSVWIERWHRMAKNFYCMFSLAGTLAWLRKWFRSLLVEICLKPKRWTLIRKIISRQRIKWSRNDAQVPAWYLQRRWTILTIMIPFPGLSKLARDNSNDALYFSWIPWFL